MINIDIDEVISYIKIIEDDISRKISLIGKKFNRENFIYFNKSKREYEVIDNYAEWKRKILHKKD